MATGKDQTTGSPYLKARAHRSRERAVYASAAVATLLAAGATFWKGREVYRQLYLHQTTASVSNLIIILISVAVIQAAYWTVLHAPPPFVIRKNHFIAHVILFLSRVSFMLAGALFSIVVLVRLEELSIRPHGLLTFIAVLFTIYCFSRWIERLGNAFARGSQPDEP